MAFYDTFPYTNFQEINLDRLMMKMIALELEQKEFINNNVIKYADPIRWDITTQYEANTVVTDVNGNAYISSRPVPAGVNITNTNYWSKIGNFDALWGAVKDGITTADEGAGTTATAPRAIGDLVWVQDDLIRVIAPMIAGDSYVIGSNCVATDIDDELKTLRTNVTNLGTALTDEIRERTEADQEINDALAEEIDTRETADNALRRLIERAGNYVNVKNYGAVGDGVTDDYPAFRDAYNEAKYGSYIVVPYGTYNLSVNPMGSKPVTWLIDQGTEFTGAGAGNTATGAGGFGSTYITNPWLETSGLYAIVDTNGRSSAGGVTNALSIEMKPIQVGDGGSLNRDWRNILYLGANTGLDGIPYNSVGNVEIINEVLNITAQKGIMEELDLNTYATIPDFCAALFITGGGTVRTDCTAIDIQRDSWLTHWTNAISVRQADTVVFCEKVINGFLMNRYNDNTLEGNAFQLRSQDGNTEICAIGADGWIRTQGINYIGNGIFGGSVNPTGYIIIRINGQDHKVPIE